jgi:hypothetical protein
MIKGHEYTPHPTLKAAFVRINGADEAKNMP